MKLGDGSADRVQETISVYGLLNPSVKFEAVFRFLGDRVAMRRGHAENMDDVLRAWNSHASHGEVSSGIMLNLVMIPARDAVKQGKSTLLLLDEPEGGQSPENLLEMCNTIQQFCQMALQTTAQGHPFYIIVATQSPFVLMAARRGGARDMDLGGWRVANPYPALIQTLTAV
jgi:predicted ATPase